jgi:hypothetical protein
MTGGISAQFGGLKADCNRTFGGLKAEGKTKLRHEFAEQHGMGCARH